MIEAAPPQVDAFQYPAEEPGEGAALFPRGQGEERSGGPERAPGLGSARVRFARFWPGLGGEARSERMSKEAGGDLEGEAAGRGL